MISIINKIKLLFLNNDVDQLKFKIAIIFNVLLILVLELFKVNSLIIIVVLSVVTFLLAIIFSVFETYRTMSSTIKYRAVKSIKRLLKEEHGS